MMGRQLRSIAGTIGGVVVLPAVAVAAEGWPAIAAGWTDRGTGGGLAITPLVIWWLVVLAWIRTVDLVSRDASQHRISPAFWSTVCGLPLPLAALLAWWIPPVAIGIALMVLAWLVPIGVYAAVRNPKVAGAERILTLGHARRLLAGLVAPLGITIPEPVIEEELLPTVALAAAGGKDAAENDARLASASGLPGFD